MISDTIKNSQKEQEKTAQPARPDDQGNIQIDCHLRIMDPNTKKVLVETRA